MTPQDVPAPGTAQVARPTVGRIVHYHDRFVDTPQAAIVTQVGDIEPLVVNLTVFPPHSASYPMSGIPHESLAGGDASRWSWPPILSPNPKS